VVDLASVQHLGPSRLTRRALASVNRDVRPVFLKGCGFADWEIAAAALHDDDLSQAQLTELTYEINRLKSSQPIQYYSVFISYSHGDLAFAKKLDHALDRYGIRCWRDEHQMLPGDDIYEQIDRGIKLWDKFLLCCSNHSLSSWWVDNEIDTVFDKERRLMKERGSKVFCLIPLDLDGYVHNDAFASGKKRQIESRVAADFRKWATDEDDFQRQVKRLIRALSLDNGGREPPPMSRL
jgi:TIR domain